MTKKREFVWSGAGRFAPWLGVTILVLAGLGACNGDTLYDAPPEGTIPPGVGLQVAGAGTEILAGKPIQVVAQAADSLGLTELRIDYVGPDTGFIRLAYDPAVRSAVLDTVIVTPAGVGGNLSVTATAVNRYGAVATSDPIVRIVAATDTVAPSLALEAVDLPSRMELDDTLSVSVVAADNELGSGIVRIGLAIVVGSSTRSDTLVFQQTVDTGQPENGTVRAIFDVTPPFATAATVPDTMSLFFHAFAVDSAGNCAGAVDAVVQRIACIQESDAAGTHTLADATAPERGTIVVAGWSAELPEDADIADGVADVFRRRLYLSNRQSGRIEVLDLSARAFAYSVRVGSEPWGIALNRSQDTLIVANSGGTSISFVSLNGTPVEDAAKRFNTLNTPLFEVSGFEPNIDSLGMTLYDYSDRPQFVAQDAAGRLLYSTIATAARPNATLRIVTHQPGWLHPEVRILRGPDAVNPLPIPAPGSQLVIANVDSVRRDGRTSKIVIFDHVNGDPTQVLSTLLLRPDSAIMAMAAMAGSDIYWREGSWNQPDLTYNDPTFVSASADHNRIVFGEGTSSTGRIILWKSDSSDVSNEITVADLVGNGSEHILDVQLNADGTLGLARGMYGAYTFKRDLRLQGFVRPVSAAGRSGAVLHPSHPSTPTYNQLPPSDPNTVAFADDGDVIRIFDTTNFVARGEIPIRDAIVGPLRVSAPLAGEAGICPGPECIVAKLYGVTNTGNVVVIDVRERYIK